MTKASSPISAAYVVDYTVDLVQLSKRHVACSIDLDCKINGISRVSGHTQRIAENSPGARLVQAAHEISARQEIFGAGTITGVGPAALNVPRGDTAVDGVGVV